MKLMNVNLMNVKLMKKIGNTEFNNLAILMVASTFCLSLSGCQMFFGNDNQVTDPLQFKEQGLSCVRSVGQDLSAFFSGGPQDPVQIVDCISGALAKFASSTRGANQDGWTRSELSSFFETYFRAESGEVASTTQTVTSAVTPTVTPTVVAQAPMDSTINPVISIEENESSAHLSKSVIGSSLNAVTRINANPMNTTSAPRVNRPFDSGWVAQAKRRAIVGEIFKWKSSLIGGGDQTLSRLEMERIRSFLMKIRVPLANWRGRGAILAFHTNRDKDEIKFLASTELESLISSVRSVSDALIEELKWRGSEAKQLRETMKIDVMARSLEKSGFPSLANPERQELAKILKSLAVAGDPESIVGEEWPHLVSQSTDLWISAMRLVYGAENIKVLDALISDVSIVLQRTLDRHQGTVDIELLRALFVQLEKNKILPPFMRSRSLNASMNVILGKLLAGNSHPRKAILARGFMLEHVEKLEQIARDWLEGERVGIEVVGPSGFASLPQARVTMSQIASLAKDEIGQTARAQMSELILYGRPLVHDFQDRLLILADYQIPGFRRSDLSKLNLSRTIANIVLRAYAHESNRAGAMPQITDLEAQEAFLDLKVIGRDAGIIDIRSLQSGMRTFMEAGIFLSVSDGNQFISLHEGVEWLAIVSAAGKVADSIHQDLLDQCGTNPLDVFGKLRLKGKCFRDGSLNVLRNRMSHLPNVMRAINQADREGRFPILLRAIENASRVLGENELPVETSELRAMSPILHYAESLFARHDTNRSGLLDQPEVWGIFPLIQPFIQSMAGGRQLTDGEARAVFSWILKYGEPPQTNFSGLAKLKLYQGRMKLGLTTERADVQDVLTILASFNQVGREKKNKEVLTYYKESASVWEAGIARSDRKIFEKTRQIFQCAQEADIDLARVFLSRRSEIFAVDTKLDKDEQALAFLNRAKSMIQSDPQLQLVCGAF